MINAQLSELLSGIAAVDALQDAECSGLQLHSLRVSPNDLYVANIGADPRAANFAKQALDRGAVAVLVDSQAELDSQLAADAKVVPVRGLIAKLGLIAARYYGNPSHNMLVIGVTGTNGKTSCCVMQAQLLELLGVSTNYLGTLGAGSLDQLDVTGFTTPPADLLQQLLYRAYSQSVRAVALEVSSHGLVQHRVAATDINVAVLTNLSREHLDYHETMEKYGAAKAELFEMDGVQVAVINIDDDFGRRLADGLDDRLQVVRVSLRAADADFYLKNIVANGDGFEVLLASPEGEALIETPLLGEFNLYNLLLVTAATYAAGYPLADIVPQLGRLRAPLGRMQLVADSTPHVVVDYAHTPDALEKACEAVLSHCKGRLILVFGCGGDRDIGKRPEMGQIAAANADMVVLTNDNPRTESPEEIVEQILLGIPVGSLVLVELDRRKAIAAAIGEANPNDCVLIAGKGHELYQEIAGERLPFSDINEARAALGVVA